MSGNTQYLYIGNQNKPLSQLNGYESGSFTVGTDIPGDPAYGCPKNFVANYMCGSKNKSLNIDGEAGGKKAIFDCTNEVDNCDKTPTVGLMQDDGNFVIYDGTLNNIKNPRWSTKTAGKMSSRQGVNLIKGETVFSNMPTNSSIHPGQKLTNPNQNGTFYMDNTGNIKIDKYELNQAVDKKGNIMGVGGDQPSFALYQVDPTNAAKNLFKTGYVDIDGVLREYPDNMLEFKDKYENDPYLLASCAGHLEIMIYLKKEHNWDIHVKNHVGEDAYLLASYNGNLEIMKYLEKEHNWDIHVKSYTNNDAYLAASFGDKLEIMKYLKKEHNWDIHVKNKKGKNAYHYGNDEIKKHLDELYKKEKEEKVSNLEEELKLEKEKNSKLEEELKQIKETLKKFIS